MVKFLLLKRKLTYRGHVFSEPIRPENVQQAVEFLKVNNTLYHGWNYTPELVIPPSDNTEQNQTFEIDEDDLQEVDNLFDDLQVVLLRPC